MPHSAPIPATTTDHGLALLGYDLSKPHNYLIVASDTLPGAEPHLLDRYRHNHSTLCGMPVSDAFEILPAGSSFCPHCYNALVSRVNHQLGWNLPFMPIA